ncbi:MAG: glycosyltransferase family 39 protein [Anaerolineales bacterium]|nr:glycosyltransferase family 39 protein [Anaerolineales bacterium]
MKQTKYIPLSIIIFLAVLARVAAALFLKDDVIDLPGTSDQISYHTLALRLLEGHGFSFGKPWWPLTDANAPTAHWSFLYTYYVAAVYAIFGPHPLIARLIQAIIVGILHPGLAYWLGKRLFSVPVGLAAAGLTAFYPYFVYYSATLMTEPFYITGILAGLSLAILLAEERLTSLNNSRGVIKLSLALGAVLGAVVLLRQLFLLFIPYIIFWVWLASGRKFSKPLLFSSSIIVVVIVLFILPFTIYNYQRFHRFVLLNTNAGYAFFWANHPVYGVHFEPILPPELGTYRGLIPEELRGLDEAALDQALLKRGLQFVLDDPWRYLRLSLSRIPPFFMFWPSPDSGLISNLSRVGGYGLLLPLMIYGVVRSFIPRPPVSRMRLGSSAVLLLLFMFVYTLIHLLSWTLIRYRLPVDAVSIVFAGLAVFDLGNFTSRRFGFQKTQI